MIFTSLKAVARIKMERCTLRIEAKSANFFEGEMRVKDCAWHWKVIYRFLLEIRKQSFSK